jgi:hypothetical protein
MKTEQQCGNKRKTKFSNNGGRNILPHSMKSTSTLKKGL